MELQETIVMKTIIMKVGEIIMKKRERVANDGDRQKANTERK